MPERGERSADEREAARQERERRRAGPEAGARLEPDGPADHGELEDERLEDEPLEGGPLEGGRLEGGRLEGESLEEEPLEDEEWFDDEDEPLHGAASNGDAHGRRDAEPVLSDPPREVPSGTRRVARVHRASRRAADAERLELARADAGTSRPRERHSWLRRGLSLVALVVAGVAIWFLIELFQPFQGSGHGSVTVTIPPKSSSGAVGDLLAHDGVISSSFFFRLRATLAGDRGSLRPGTYHLKLGMGYGSVLKILTTPPPAVPTTNVTIIPGETRAKLAKLLHEQGVRGNYLLATRHSRLLNPRSYGAPRSTPSLEGFLFPDTYQLRKPVKIPALVADQLTDFKQKFATVNLSYARSRHLTPYQVLTIASMVEEEAEVERDRPLIASVIYNRLALGMPLQIDATTRYATGNYTEPLTESQLNSPSPYNTRNHKGLPPTPIGSPGMASIEAAAHPAQTNYLYFVVKPCGNGEHAFASSYAQFEKDVSQYDTARARRGGHSPATCTR